MQELILESANIHANTFYSTVAIVVIGSMVLLAGVRAKLLSVLVAAVLFVGVLVAAHFYREHRLSYSWHRASYSADKLVLTFDTADAASANTTGKADSAKNAYHTRAFSCNSIASLAPRYNKNSCELIVRTQSETFTSAAIDSDKCNAYAQHIKTRMGCAINPAAK
ncbi:hypothetical protein [Teredinibacter turnerae]|uniref:hypothetical protein n=1 Tax=Teredinibacter turnerae TaxID=2426 RepID=UPI00056C4D08|nr:hypothetical protein [Teredinibacter turnerae]